jgi:hypothetical protein
MCVNLGSSKRGVLVQQAAESNDTSVFFQIPPLIIILILALFSLTGRSRHYDSTKVLMDTT